MSDLRSREDYATCVTLPVLLPALSVIGCLVRVEAMRRPSFAGAFLSLRDDCIPTLTEPKHQPLKIPVWTNHRALRIYLLPRAAFELFFPRYSPIGSEPGRISRDS